MEAVKDFTNEILARFNTKTKVDYKKNFGQLDCLVNNAGVIDYKKVGSV